MTGISDILQAAVRLFTPNAFRRSKLFLALRPLYENTLAILSGRKGISWSINSLPCRIDPRARDLIGKEWDPEVAEFIAERIKPNSVCLDIGANAGIYVIQFCWWTRPRGRVIAFGPNPQTLVLLRNHLRMNGIEDRVEIVESAISDHSGTAEFHSHGASGMNRLGSVNPLLKGRTAKTTVSTTTIDDYCRDHHCQPDWLLIDIEGYELQALRGAEKLIRETSALHIVVEMHPTLWESVGTNAEAFRLYFQQMNIRPVPLSGQSDCLCDYGTVYLDRLE